MREFTRMIPAIGSLCSWSRLCVILLLMLLAFGQQAMAANANPTLDSIDVLTGLGSEDSDIIISYAALKAAANEADVDGGTINFRIIVLSSGVVNSFIIRPAGATGGGSTAVGATLDSTKEVVWRPALNTNGNQPAFAVRAVDASDALSAFDEFVTVNVAAVNDAPTLTVVATLTASNQAALGQEDSINGITISYTHLQSAAQPSDVESGTIDFLIGTISSGTLMIRSGSGGPGDPAAGQRFSSNEELIWRPAANVSGDAVEAFTIQAIDSGDGVSAAKPVTVKVSAVNDAPTLSTIALLTGLAGIPLGNEDSPIVVSHAALRGAADVADIDSPIINFRITSISGAGLTIRAAGSLVAGTPALNQTLDSANELVWKPSAHANGDLPAFVVKAIDGSSALSLNERTVSIRVAPVPDLPEMTSIQTLTNGTEDTDFIIRHADVAGKANAADADNNGAIDFKVVGFIPGTLGVRAPNTTTTPTPVVGTVTLTALNELVWRPAANANGVLTACTMVAHASDGDSLNPIELKVDVAPVNDFVVVTSAISPVQYSLNINGFSILLPDALTIVDPDGQPVLVSGNSLTITCTVSLNWVANQDQLVVRNTADCLVNTLDNGSWEIFSRANPTFKIAIASSSGSFRASGLSTRSPSTRLSMTI